MASTRFNNYLRTEARRVLIEYAFKDRQSALETREKDIFIACVTQHYGRDVLGRIAGLPREWFMTINQCDVVASGWRGHIKGHGVSVPVPYFGGHYRPDIQIKDIALIDTVKAFLTDKEETKKAREALAAQLHSLLQTMPSFERLYEIEPDFEAILSPMLKVISAAKSTALVPLAGAVMCGIAKARGEVREGCPG